MENRGRSPALDRGRLKKLENKEYRDAYLQSHVRGGIAYQIHALREKLKLSQAEFAQKINKPQSVVSRLEDTEYGKVTIQTLLDIAGALDVALLVRFVAYPQFLRETADMSPRTLAAESIFETQEKLNAATSRSRIFQRATANLPEVRAVLFAEDQDTFGKYEVNNLISRGAREIYPTRRINEKTDLSSQLADIPWN
jgi:transcriptional regulator with XRE-family HTH domain